MQDKINNKKILVAPLDWGLGHATRCIPVIKTLLHNGCTVVIAASGKNEQLLKKEFPLLEFLPLPGYNITYARHGFLFLFKIVQQIPKILRAIKDEHTWLQQAITKHNIDIVISDNRYGLYSDKIPCIFITHQLTIIAPKAVEGLLQRINYKYINKFTQCWVPDNVQQPWLAGRLSHPNKMPVKPVLYLGPLVRFNKDEHSDISPKKYTYCFILSGPEPQRSKLENNVLSQLHNIKDEIIIVRAKPGDTDFPMVPNNVSIYNHLDTAHMQQAIINSEFIISRAGYTTIMELFALQKKSILIPTAGQTEQEYLGSYLMQQGFCFCVDEKKFDMQSTLKIAKKFDYKIFNKAEDALQQAVVAIIQD